MANCPACGTANVSGKFCPNCGAQLPSAPPVAPAAMPQPPQHGQVPPPAPSYPPQQPGYPPQQPGYYRAQPAPQKKSSGGLVAAAMVGGVLVLVVGGFLAWRAVQKPDTPPAKPAAPAVTDNKPAPEPAKPAPEPAKPAPAPATATLKANVVAKGKLDFAFQSYDGFAGNQLALARTEGDRSKVMVYEFGKGKFEPVVEVDQPLGKVNDVNHGPIFNDGKDYALIPAEQGMVVVPEDGDADQYTGKNIQHILVGDYDGDKQYETLVIGQDGANFVLNLFRYGPGAQGPKLKSTTMPVWLSGAQVVNLAGANKALILGVDTIKIQDKLPVALYQTDTNLNLTQFALLPIHQAAGEQVTGYAAGSIGGKPTLAVAYDGAPGYLELFDINVAQPSKSTAAAPTSRGKVALPQGSGYQVIMGSFTAKGAQEVLVLSGDGNYAIYSF